MSKKRNRFYRKDSVFSHEKAELALAYLKEIHMARTASSQEPLLGRAFEPQFEFLEEFIREAQKLAPYENDPCEEKPFFENHP